MAISADKKQKEFVIQLLFLLVFLGGLVWLLYSLGVFEKKDPEFHEITFRVEGSAAAAVITYTQANGERTPPTDVRVPWKKTLRFDQTTMVVLTAGNPAQTGDLRCSILINGEEWREEAARAPNDKVSCAGIVP